MLSRAIVLAAALAAALLVPGADAFRFRVPAAPSLARRSRAPAAASALRPTTHLFADPEGSDEPGTDLIKVNPSNVEAAAGVTGAVLGFAVFGNPLFAVMLAALGNYGAKQEGDAGEAIRGLSNGVLNSVNFLGRINERYSVGTKVSSSLGNAFETIKAKDTSEGKVVEKVEGFFSKVKDSVKELDEEVDLKKKAGEFVYAAGDISTKAIEKADELNQKYKLTDQAGEKVKDFVEKAKDAADKKQ